MKKKTKQEIFCALLKDGYITLTIPRMKTMKKDKNNAVDHIISLYADLIKAGFCKLYRPSDECINVYYLEPVHDILEHWEENEYDDESKYMHRAGSIYEINNDRWCQLLSASKLEKYTEYKKYAELSTRVDMPEYIDE